MTRSSSQYANLRDEINNLFVERAKFPLLQFPKNTSKGLDPLFDFFFFWRKLFLEFCNTKCVIPSFYEVININNHENATTLRFFIKDSDYSYYFCTTIQPSLPAVNMPAGLPPSAGWPQLTRFHRRRETPDHSLPQAAHCKQVAWSRSSVSKFSPLFFFRFFFFFLKGK